MAIALRNRWRRQQVDEKLRHEITPKNILMIGPTGVGKTEIARRLARLADAPFIKVEATKFTEVGYVGKDVDSIIRDLAEMAVKQTREAESAKVRTRAEDARRGAHPRRAAAAGAHAPTARAPTAANATRQAFRKKLREGELDDKEIEIELAEQRTPLEIMGPAGMEEMTEQLRGMFGQLGQARRKTRKLKISEAMQPAGRRGGRQAGQRGRDPRRRRSPTPSRTASSSSTRSTRSPSRSETQRRRRVAPGRAARPAAAGRGHDGVHQVRRGRAPTTSCSSPAAPSTWPSRAT